MPTDLVSDEDGDEDFNALNRDGLLSSVIEEDWRIRFIDTHRVWFDYARDLNRSAMELFLRHWRAGEGGYSNALHPTAGRALARCLNHYAAAVMLCERGLAIDAANAARNTFEAGFWLAYMAAAPEQAVSDLEADDLKGWIARERELQRVVSDANTVATSKTNETAYVAKLGDRKPPTIAKIAREHGQHYGYLQYRILSGHYGHLSQASLGHNFRRTGEKAGLNVIGPHDQEILKVLYFASIAFGEAQCPQPVRLLVGRGWPI